MVQLRSLIRHHVWSMIGDGRNTSAWFDTWSSIGPLCTFLSPRVITREGFSLNATVADIYSNGSWIWPVAWRDMFPVLIQLDHLHRNLNVPDHLLWKDGDIVAEHSSSGVWDSVRTREQEVDWAAIIWFSQCIPRHAFLMWLIVRRKLLTQDKILQWNHTRCNNMNMMCCLLCHGNVDSHAHLFFECKLSMQVWEMVRSKAGMENVDSTWGDIFEWLGLHSRSKSATHMVSRLLVAALAYTIWQERNNRLFRNQTRPPDVLCQAVLESVRYKLMGLKFKNNARVWELLEKWDIHGADIVMANE
ncbi:uncharacterized protein LOC110896117 [Helianthus annuus]|uniref:uncharacterized protein LOC110896117 n=1 Tax=Helianthus annuus TaxID=4232 RepID=UPI000B8EF7B4|nr:uncharacterized protein LOC110896117 [Helianthus annuus]